VAEGATTVSWRQQFQYFGDLEGDMPRSYDTLTLEDAKRVLSAAEAKAASFRIAYNIAVVDVGGHLVAFVRQDGALLAALTLLSIRR